MKKTNLKLLAVPAIYIAAIIMFGSGMLLVESIINKKEFKDPHKLEYVSSEIVTDNEYVPVVNITPTIMKPFLNENVAINRTFYKQDASKEEQEKSIILYENTYIQNSGIDYKYNESFDIIAVLDGTIIDISDNEILGKTIKIRHNNDIISTYQSMGEVTVNKDEAVLRGQVIGKSGTCKLYSDDYNLHFEIAKSGQNINPEESYNKTEDEI